MRIISFSSAILASLLALTASGNVTYQISGSVKNGDPVFAGSPLDVLPVGTTFDATFVYDPSASVMATYPTQQTYSFVSSTVTFHPFGENWTASSDQTNNVVTVRNDTFVDQIQFSANATGLVLGSFTPNSLQIVFGGSNLVLGSTDLPGSLDLADWNPDYTSTYLKIYFNNETSSISADITSMNTSAVPEPSTYAAIAGLSILGFVAWHRRGRASRQS